MRHQTLTVAAGALILSCVMTPAVAQTRLLNVSYDPTRELYREYNSAFATQWKQRTGSDVTIQQSHGGSGAQARAVIDGLEAEVKDFVGQLYRNVPVLDTGARASTTTFVRRGIGDVLLAWENEAFLALDELGPGKFEIVVPSISIKAEPSVALVDKNAAARGTTEAASGYLEYLYSDVGQRIVAKHHYRPSKPELASAEDRKRFPELRLATIEDFGGWKAVQPQFFGDGGIFDTIYKPGPK